MSKTQRYLNRDTFVLFIKFIIIPLILIAIASRIFIVRTYQRELFYSTSAYINRDTLNVGADGYGTISSIEVNVGDYVNKGDVLYKYSNADLDKRIYDLSQQGIEVILNQTIDGNISLNEFNKNVEFQVTAQKDGIIKQVNITAGDFVSKDSDAMVMESQDTFVTAQIKVPPELISRIKPRLKVYIKISPTITVLGYVKNVYPDYDARANELKIDAVINNDELSRVDFATLYTGSPVNIVVESPDAFTEEVKARINQYNIKFLKQILNYEV